MMRTVELLSEASPMMVRIAGPRQERLGSTGLHVSWREQIHPMARSASSSWKMFIEFMP